MKNEEPAKQDAKALNDFLSKVYNELKAPFPKEALSTDSSRGFDLTSVKAQYVVERLNEVVGIGNWRHSGQYELVDNGVIFKGQLIISNAEVHATAGTSREAVGFSMIKKNVGDAYKGAKTDSLSKCASQLGLANEIFKGNVAPPSKSKPKAKPKANLKMASNDDF